MFNPFRIFYWGFATVLKLALVACTYVLLGGMLIGAAMFFFYLTQVVPDFVGNYLEGSMLLLPGVLVLLFGAMAIYGGICSVIISPLFGLIAWSFKKEARYTVGAANDLYHGLTD